MNRLHDRQEFYKNYKDRKVKGDMGRLEVNNHLKILRFSDYKFIWDGKKDINYFEEFRGIQ